MGVRDFKKVACDSTTSGGSRNRGGYWRGFRGVTRGEGGGGGGGGRERKG